MGKIKRLRNSKTKMSRTQRFQKLGTAMENRKGGLVIWSKVENKLNLFATQIESCRAGKSSGTL